MASRSKKPPKGKDMAAVPWGAIIGVLPSLIEASASLFKKADPPKESLPEVPATNPEKQLEAVIARLEYFETLEADQAQVLKQTIEQLQNVTILSSGLAKRANIALSVAAVSIVLAVASLALG